MAKKLKQALISKQEAKIHRYLIAFPVIAFAIKLITVFNIQGGTWLGADGENYLKGAKALHVDGLFSKADILNYWPAGYPILIWLLTLISLSKFAYLISFTQSIFFGYATYHLTKNISRTSINWVAIPVSLFISLNPTLSLSTLLVGYEAPVAACFMMALSTIVASKRTVGGFQFRYSLVAGAWLALATFMQPRYLLPGVVLFTIWGATFIPKQNAIKVGSLALVVMLISPICLITRNTIATKNSTISTNLGVTMSIGAGDKTKGGFTRTGPAVPCEPLAQATSVTDNQRVICVLKWYSANPVKALKLALYKSEFFWSPWSGPLANGTMQRNPWLKFAPTELIAKNKTGIDFVFGPIGELISWVWIILQLVFLFLGYLDLNRRDKISKLIANIALSSVLLSWLVSIGTIGDNRFRLPTMGMSILLQVVGAREVKNKLFKVL